jgi:hypothetical protein
MKIILLTAFVVASLIEVHAAVLLPVADGSVYYDGAVITSAYVTTSGSDIHGDLQFASFNSANYSSIELELNPYGEPLFGNPVSVYGYDNAAGQLTGSDYSAGTYLGALVLPVNLGYGQPVLFDVTAFVHSVTGSFFGFELQSSSTDVFSSTAYNYGTPPELIAVPEPDNGAFFSAAGLLAALAAYINYKSGFDSSHSHNSSQHKNSCKCNGIKFGLDLKWTQM